MNIKHFLRESFLCMLGLIVISMMSLFADTIGWAQMPTPYKPPKVIYWGTGDVGTHFYALAAAISDKIAPVLGSKFRIIPGNDVDRINMLRAGKAQLGSLAADAYWASMGLAHYSTPTLGPQPLRIFWTGLPYYAPSTGIATAASGIKAPHDLKGKRLIRIVGSAWSSEGIRASLAFANLTLDDVTVVEVSTSGAANKALVEGKADYTMMGNTTPGIYEAEASPYGIYIVRFPHEDKEGWARYRKFMPYHVPGIATEGAGIKPGEKVPTPTYSYPSFATFADQPDELVYVICRAIYSKMDEIATALPGNEAMRSERAIRPEATIMAPFHPGAVKFFREIGVWKDAHDVAQKTRLAHLDKVNKRWLTFVQEAQDRLAKTQKKIDLTREWREIVEKEIGLLP